VPIYIHAYRHVKNARKLSLASWIINTHICAILLLKGVDREVLSLLKCDILSVVFKFLTFRKMIAPSSLGSSSPRGTHVAKKCVTGVLISP